MNHHRKIHITCLLILGISLLSTLSGKGKLHPHHGAFPEGASFESYVPDYKLVKEEPGPSDFAKGAWTLAIIPDTQHYFWDTWFAERGPVVESMFEWLEKNHESRNMEAIIHVGDLTSRNMEDQWERVRECYRKLDGKVPYVLCEGNHDCIKKNQKKFKQRESIVGFDGATKMNDYFKIEDNPLNEAIYGGSFEGRRMENAYYTFEKNGQKFLILALEFATRDNVRKWASDVVKEHSDHRIFITIHEYLHEKNRLMSENGVPTPGNKDIFDFVLAHSNVEFLVCGHAGCMVFIEKLPKGFDLTGKNGPRGLEDKLIYDPDLSTARRTDYHENGLAVHQILFNAQFVPNGGDGWLMLMEFQPDNKSVKVKTYSTYRDEWRTGNEYFYVLNREGDL